MVRIRPAIREDLDGIMLLEKETFGVIGESAMAQRKMMEDRIRICNAEEPFWFWVAESDGNVVGDIILQPMDVVPERCFSWSQATSEGKLCNFSPKGENIFVVSFASDESVPGVSDLLARKAFELWRDNQKKHFMFCSRMPGFRKYSQRTGARAEDYWHKRRRDGSPKDWMLREFYSMTGSFPYKLLVNGYPPDLDSGGHGVLFVANDPHLALRRIDSRISRNSS
jgi:hypothetical protein